MTTQTSTKKWIVTRSNGVKTMEFEGQHLVDSVWSGGEKRTRFQILLGTDGRVRINPLGKSRVPAFDDAWDALQLFLEELEMDIPEEHPAGMRKVATGHKAMYVGLNGHFIGRSADGKFSFRGEDSMPIEIVRQLLYPLDDFLESQGL